jgi:superfamily I DNA/RNA helicase
MRWTKEQKAILDSQGDIKVNAVAGSGKTTTIIEYARMRQEGSRILYLAFNKSVKLEAAKIFKEEGLNHVRVETAHSLAYKEIVFRYKYKVRNSGYKTHELAEILNLPGANEKHGQYIIANHVNKYAAYFCNSNAEKVQDLDYLNTIADSKAKIFVTSFYEIILKQTRIFLAMMNSGQIEITHDFYLKKFQLSKPRLDFDFILFDEGQDASPTMLDVFFRQNATKVIVGDKNQQIYGWRYAINSLDKANFKNYRLGTSFRFRNDIAELAMGVLDWKENLGDFEEVEIKGKGGSNSKKVKAILARTNLGLLLRAIDFVSENNRINGIYFEGNINSYTYAEEGASLYDVLNLYNGKKHLVRDTMIKKMNEIGDLEEYVEKTEERQLGLMIEIVKEHGNRIPRILQDIRDLHVDKDKKEEAEMIFSTVHRCKGMEYDEVEIVNDFITEERLEKITESDEPFDQAKLNEEINLLYVAITRTKNRLYIPETLMPEGYLGSKNIIVNKVETQSKKKSQQRTYQKSKNSQQKKSFQKWTEEADDLLTELYNEGVEINKLAHALGRSPTAIASRIKKLRLHEFYD